MKQKELQFRNCHAFSQDEYHELQAVFSKRTRIPRRIAVVLATIACYFSSYTLIIGMALTVLIVLSLFTKKITRFAHRNAYKESKFLRERLTYGLSNKNIWIQGKHAEVKVEWPMLKVWDFRGPWLYIACDQIPRFYFNINSMKNEGVFDQVVDLCKKHAPLFDSSDSRRRLEELYPTNDKNYSNQSVVTTPDAARPTS